MAGQKKGIRPVVLVPFQSVSMGYNYLTNDQNVIIGLQGVKRSRRRDSE